LESEYDDSIHDSILDRFRWESADSVELAHLPPVLVVLPASSARLVSLHALSALLRSGCPIQVLITRPSLTEEDLLGDAIDFGALAISFRSARVVQSSLAFPSHLLPELEAAAISMRPSLVVLATPSGGGWPESVILSISKAWSLFCFNPEQGSSWSSCIRIHSLEVNMWTPAHAAALNPAFQSQFRLLPERAEAHEAIQIGSYLDQYQSRAPLAVPYFTVSRADGVEMRIAISRDLADYCHDRLVAAKLLEELAAPPKVVAAAESTHPDSRAALVREGAELAIARVVAILTGAEK
jgi:hypothetical protein